MSLPLLVAWRNLIHDPVRFGLYVGGITFAVVLIGVQYGILQAMLESNVRLLECLDGDLVLIHPQRASVMFRAAFPRQRLEQARSVDSVHCVMPLYLDYQAGEWLATGVARPQRGPARRIRVVGVDLQRNPLRTLNIPFQDWQRLQLPGTALYDRWARPAPPPFAPTVYGPLHEGIQGELTGQKLTLVGDGFELGFDFAADGTLIVSDRTFARYLRANMAFAAKDPLDDIDLGVIRCAADSSVATVQITLKKMFAAMPDVEVLTLSELIQREKRFWLMNTPIGFAFGAGMILGFIVGLVICYQILTGNIADHVGQYATLRAIGHGPAFLRAIVGAEALLLAGLGLAVGIAVVAAAQSVLTDWTAMPFRLPLQRVLALAGVTTTMCWLSARLAARHVEKVDPADVF
ncbi:MAG: FtsX-like permease family protein [Gemmataceae bacterium]|nr:FtsX-like permease family protein [Gemmataceae bacterium]